LDENLSGTCKYLGPLPAADKSKRSGLINIDEKTCYANAFLQCLAHVPHFYFRIGTAIKLKGDDAAPYIKSMWTILKGINAGKQPTEEQMTDFVIKLNDAIKAKVPLISNEGFIQSDSAEVLEFLLAHLNSDLVFGHTPVVMKNEHTFDDLFGIFKIEARKNRNSEGTLEDITSNMLRVHPAPEIVSEHWAYAVKKEKMMELAKKPMTAQQEIEFAAFSNTVAPSARLDLEQLIFATLDDDISVNELGDWQTKITQQIKALPPYLFINFSRSMSDYSKELGRPVSFRMGNPIEFPLKYLPG
jgi:hypothetical protein